MRKLIGHLSVKIDESLFIKDPITSDVGLAIIRKSVDMIYAEGLESFTFRKLANALNSTESTIYRYFQNKQQLTMYLVSWYWNLLEWKMAFAVANVESPVFMMEKVLRTLSHPVDEESYTNYFDEKKLKEIVLIYGFRSIDTKGLKKKERIGYFSAYANLCARLESIILLHRKNFKTPRALANVLIETSSFQMMLRNRLPELTDLGNSDNDLFELLSQIVYKSLEDKK